jgi:hypothetical protein
MRSWLMRGAVMLGTVGIASAVYQVAAEARDRRRFPPPGRLADVGGRFLHLLEAGAGSPAVVIVPAIGGNVLDWLAFHRELATDMRVCVYDRAGFGFPVKSMCRSPGHYFSRTETRMPEDAVLVGDQRPVPADWRPGAVSDPQRRGQRPRHRRRARPRQAIEMIRDTLAWNITRSGPEKGREGLAAEESGATPTGPDDRTGRLSHFRTPVVRGRLLVFGGYTTPETKWWARRRRTHHTPTRVGGFRLR